MGDAEGRWRAMALAVESGCFVDAICPPLITIYHNVISFKEGGETFERTDFVGRLQAEFGSRAKVVHGAATASVGNIGSKDRFSYGVVAAWQEPVLIHLTQQKFGEYSEWHS